MDLSYGEAGWNKPGTDIRSSIMQGESGSWITWLPIALAGIGFNFWIPWYLLGEWLGVTGQPVPLLGYLISVASALVIVAFFGYIFKGMFGESPARKGGICI